MANEFDDVIVTIGVPGINGGGISSGDLAAAIADRAPVYPKSACLSFRGEERERKAAVIPPSQQPSSALMRSM